MRTVSDPDVVVVGSGAAGGMAAYALTRAGVRVLMLEAGRDYDPITESPMFQLPSDAPLRGAATPDKEEGFFDATAGGGWEVPGEPYTVAEGSRFRWWRARMLGGRTNHWGRVALRFGPYDFQGRQRDGLGADWPIRYEDLAPFYDRVEGLIGVFGAAEGQENSPDSPPGLLHDPPPARAYEAWLKLVLGRRFGIPVVPAHMAILTRRHGDRPPCFYATDCQRGCAIRANFQTPTVLLPPALATGRLGIRTHSQVIEVIADRRGRASAVVYIDTRTGAQHRVRTRCVMLGASTVESARILLNSRSAAFPNGLGNSNGEVGRHLTDSPVYAVSMQIPQLEDLPPFADEGVTLTHTYAPWWLYPEQRAGRFDFARGYALQLWGGRRLPEFDEMERVAEISGAYGLRLHRDMRRLYGSVVHLSARGEMLPNDESFCELDPAVKDQWGVPVVRFHWKWGPQEIAQMRHARRLLIDIARAQGAKVLSTVDASIESSMRPGGAVSHEAGACRMGCDRRDSVLNEHGRVWEVPGLYVIDAGAFPSNPYKNPTLTILALAWRSADHVIDTMRRREL